MEARALGTVISKPTPPLGYRDSTTWELNVESKPTGSRQVVTRRTEPLYTAHGVVQNSNKVPEVCPFRKCNPGCVGITTSP